MINKMNIKSASEQVEGFWNPAILADVNNHQVKLARFKDEFIWHKHDHEDEMFMVVSGTLIMHLRDQVITLEPGELLVIPKGVEHKPASPDEVLVMMFEPAETINTGDQKESARTVKDLKRI